MIVRVSAPGKMMVSGEYVVLEGAEALVAAVDARLLAIGSEPPADGSGAPRDGSPDADGLPPEAVLARKEAERALGPVAMQLTLDRSALNRDGRKLGLGSSSAAAAAAAGAVLAWRGEDPAAHRERVFAWALAGHHAVAPQGSGADVAAATLGGIVRYRRDAPEEARRVDWPGALRVEIVWTGRPARTSELVAQVKRLAADDPRAYAAAMSRLRGAAEALADAIGRGDAKAAATAAGAHGEAMDGLGQASGAPIVTDALRRVARLAAERGGGAKPSGAGGGDVALAFFAEDAAAESFRAACEAAGLTLLPLQLGAEGVRVDADPPSPHTT